MEPVPAAATYRFDGFVLDLKRGALLTTAGVEVALRRQSFELLRLLVENAGRLLDRDTINRTIWGEITVSDDSIAQCIRDIRRALGDEAQQILKTVPRRGYLMVAVVATARHSPLNTVFAGRTSLRSPCCPSPILVTIQSRSILPTAWLMRSSRRSAASGGSSSSPAIRVFCQGAGRRRDPRRT